jgi:hypothetical protein
MGTLVPMTGAPYGNWGPGQSGPGGTGASGWPPNGPPPASPHPPPYPPQGYPQQPPYVPQQPPYVPPPQPYGPAQHPVQGAQPYSSFAPKRPTPAPAAPPPGSLPLGAAKPASLSIDTYMPPKRRVGSLIAFLVGFAVLIGGFMAVDYFTRTAQNAPTSSPSPTATLPGLAFETDSATGSWEITNTQWSPSYVVLTVRITVATGSFRYSFYAYNNTSMKLAYPDSSSSNTLRTGTLGAGQTVSGTLSFQITRGDGTLVMLDALENQVSGLAIKP